MNPENYVKANGIAWDEASSIHANHTLEQLKTNFQHTNYNCLDSIARHLFCMLDINNKFIAQLGCNNGRELLSLKNMGAGRCVGFDISPGFINQSLELAALTKISCDFICCDIYQISDNYNNQFDLIYISVGVLHWLPDLKKFFAVVARLLKSHGCLFIYEMHPFIGMFNEHDKQNPKNIFYSYFDKQPKLDDAGLDYIGNTKYTASASYLFQHTMSDIVTACINSNLNIYHFCEYAHDISSVYGHLEKEKIKLPLSYTLIAQKCT